MNTNTGLASTNSWIRCLVFSGVSCVNSSGLKLIKVAVVVLLGVLLTIEEEVAVKAEVIWAAAATKDRIAID